MESIAGAPKVIFCYTILMSLFLQSAPVRATLKWATMSLSALTLLMVGYGTLNPELEALQGRLLPAHTRGAIKWLTLTGPEILSGATIPPNVNVIIHIPEEIDRITRRTFFGQRSETVKYWGYCFPHTEEEAEVLNKRYGFPGLIFLSEGERDARRTEYLTKRRETFSPYTDLQNEPRLNQTEIEPRYAVRHQIDVFKGGSTCYVMSEEVLPVGADPDDDKLNNALETSFGVDPFNPDSDGDGIDDGIEVFRLGTHPKRRDSDGDGLIDGIEDADRNGRISQGETNPMEWDTDRDGLCDGICKINKGLDIRGEDKNLNGIVDEGEHDPRTPDTNGDGVLDEHDVYLCVLAGGDDC